MQMGSPGSPGCLAAGRDTAAKHHSEEEREQGRDGCCFVCLQIADSIEVRATAYRLISYLILGQDCSQP